jgi:hypothetical protein
MLHYLCFFAISMVEKTDAKGADCCVCFEARDLLPRLASSALYFFPIFGLKKFEKNVTH